MTAPYLSTRVHHALKCLVCLAQRGEPQRANELAQLTGIPPAQTAKTLYLLTWGGFVLSRRGSKGGFWLRRSSEQIRVQEVVDFFQPPDIGSSKDSEDSILRVWQETLGTPRQNFQKLTLADLVRESHKDFISKVSPKRKLKTRSSSHGKRWRAERILS